MSGTGTSPGCVCAEINMRHCPVHGQDDARSLFLSPAVLRAKANEIRVAALSMPHPSASYFVEAARLERQGDGST